MGLHGKLIVAVEFKAGGDVFHELLRHSPHDLPKATPDIVHACDLHEGEFGHVGSVICWSFTHAIEFKAGGDVFHELVRYKPEHLSTVAPEKVQGCDLHEGEFGHVGTIICWRYTHDGKEKRAKQVIQAIDEEKKLIEFKMLEGDLMELYKDFVITIHVETHGGIDLVTWTLAYEMLNEDVEHPISLLSFFIHLTKDIETHHLGKPSMTL